MVRQSLWWSRTKQSSLNYLVEGLMENRLGCPNLPYTCFPLFLTHTQKCGLFTCQKHHQTMSYSAPLWVQWEVPGPTSPYTISPKACPTPTIVQHSTHTHTMATPEPGVPLCNSITQRHTPVLIPSERKKNDRGGRGKIATLWEGWRKMSVTKRTKCVWWGCR